MIRSEQDYGAILERLERSEEALEEQRAHLEEIGLEPERMEQILAPLRAIHRELNQEAQSYVGLKNGQLEPLEDLNRIGEFLIGARIAYGLSQEDLSRMTGIPVHLIAHRERNGYAVADVSDVAKILGALGARVRIEPPAEPPVAPPPPKKPEWPSRTERARTEEVERLIT